MSQKLILIAILVSTSFSSFANPRLNKVQQVYGAEVDTVAQAATREQIGKVYTALIGQYRRAVDSFESGLDWVSQSELWFNGNITLLAKTLEPQGPLSLQQFKAIKHDLHDTATAHAQFSGGAKRLEGRALDLGGLRKALELRDLCAEFVPQIIFPPLPRYKIDETVDLSLVPRPQLKKTGNFAESDNPDLNEGVAATVGTASTAGCLAGMVGGPLGCAAGAIAGAVIGFFIGYGAQASVIAIENKAMQKAYETAKYYEQSRQEKEIKEAKEFVDSNPINIAVVQSRASSFCYTLKESRLSFTEEESELHGASLAKKAGSAVFDLQDYRQVLKNYRRDLKQALADEHPALLKNRFVAESAEISLYQNLISAIENMRKPLYGCMYDTKQTAEQKLNCWNSAYVETSAVAQESGDEIKLNSGLNKIFSDWLEELSFFEKGFLKGHTEC